MIRRTFRSVVQLIGIMGIGFAVFVGVLVWRLTTGPISLAFLTPYFETALKSADDRFNIKLEDTILTWAGWEQSLDIRLRGAKAIGPGGNVFAEIPELAVSLSGTALMKGDLAPRSLTIFGPSLNVTRTIDGKVQFGRQETDNSGATAPRSSQSLVRQIIGELMAPPDPNRPLGYLSRIDIIGGNVRVDDRLLAVIWKAPETDITLQRDGENVQVSAELIVKAGDNDINKTAAFTLRGTHDLNTKIAKISLGFADLNPVVFAPLSKKLKLLESFDLSLGGTVNTTVLTNGELRKFDFDLKSQKGKINLQDPLKLAIDVQESTLRGDFDQATGRLNINELSLDLGKTGKLKVPAPVNHEWPVQKIFAAGTYDSDFDRLEVEKFNLISGGPTLSASATVQEIGGEISFELGGEATDLRVDDAEKLWPKGWGDFARDWVLENLSVGMAPIAHARVTGRYSKEKGVELVSLLGDMDAKDLTVDYLSPMAKVTGGSGRIKFDKKRFDIEVTGGKSGDLEVLGGRLIFTGLDEFDQFLEADLDIEGPFDTALKLIDSQPLELAKLIGFNSKNTKGNVSANLALKFLLDTKITANDVAVSTTATLTNIEIPNIAIDLDLAEANLILVANNNDMTIKGDGLLGGVKTNIVWQENFANQTDFRRKYELRALIDDRSWREKLRLDFIPFNQEYLTGIIAADVTAIIKDDGKGLIEAALDLKDTAMTLPNLGWRKSRKVAANAKINAIFSEAGFLSIPQVSVTGGGMDLLAKVELGEDSKLTKVEIARLKFGKTDSEVVLAPYNDGSAGGWDVDIKGKRLDISEWIEKDKNRSEISTISDALRLSLNLDAVQISEDRILDNVSGALAFDGLVWRQAKLTTGIGENKKIEIELMPRDGKRLMTITSNDAGAALQTFDYYENLIGGRLNITGEYADMLPYSKFSGRITIDDFRVINAPVLARLLNVASVTGILENLGGVGLAFAKLDAPFENTDDIITIKDASISGLSLGLTAEGTIDTDLDVVDVKGTIVPAYALNTALTRIPLIGVLFSGGEKGGGVFAAGYTMKGDIKEPEISTNPLSVLAPGILRRLFGLFQTPSEQAPATTGAPG